MKPEVLQGDNQYFCDSCKKKVDAEKGAKFLKLPKVLCLNLNRFTYDPMTGDRVKLANFLSCPFVLNMNDYMK